MITDLALKNLSRLINQALATDPAIFSELAELHEKTLCIHVEKTPISVLVAFGPEGVCLSRAEKDVPASVSLRGAPSALLRFSKTDAHTQMLMDKKIQIHGDLDLLMRLKKIQAQAMIDWEALLAGYFGDFAANRFMLLAKGLVRRVGRHLDLFREDSLNYIHHEAALLPTEKEVESFYQDIRALRRDIDRLEVRIKRK